MNTQTGLNRAIFICGSVAELARRIGVQGPAVHQWERVPAERVLAVSEAVNWEVTPHELRPDIYPHLKDGVPEKKVA